MYVELTCKSNFSFLRGASDSREYIQRANELGMSALGVSDINGVYGLPRAFEAIRALMTDEEIELDLPPPVKLICGCEITFDNRPSIHLIAQTRKAWALLCRIITQVHAGKEKGKGFLTYDELEFLARRFEGIREITCIAKSDAKNDFPFLKRIFGDNLYISICKYLDGVDKKRMRSALDLSSNFNLPLVATNDVHYHAPLRRPLQDCVTCIREATTLDQAGFKLFGNAERYLKSSIQMEALFADLPEAIENTARIADQCTFSLRDLKYTYPKESVPTGHNAKSYLRKLVLEGAMWRYKGIISESIDRQIRRELDFFSKRGEEDYFLTMYDILTEAREKKIAFQGRGSAASSIVCYALGITAVDPISANLLFDRFASDARKDPPDIDVDFEHERREEVIQGIYARYGRDRAAMVAAVHTYQRDGAYREICKSIGVDVRTKKAEFVRANFSELAKEFASRGVFIGTLTKELHGSPRHIGTHSGGFVITNEPIIESVPIEPAAMDGRTIVQWDKHDLETLGMMKIDILSIGFLTAIRKATTYIGMDWQDIPVNDAKTYSLIQRAETAGCFQIESRAQMSSLPHTKPETPYEMTMQVARIRPAMSVGGMNRLGMRGKELAKQGRLFISRNAGMDRILRRTFGVVMFPDQIMSIAMEVCNFSSSEADQLRRSLGKERSAASVESQGEKLFRELINAGVEEPLATSILKCTQGFASYSFPEGHAASYGSLAFKSAYLKAHYPAEYLCALINSQPMGFYPIAFLINEAERNSGVKVLPVHPNKSTWDAQMAGPKTVLMGFRDIRRINDDAVNEMIEARASRPFKSIEDFITRTNFDKAVLRHLAISNAFEVFGIDRRHSFWQSIEFKNLVGFKSAGQLSFFDQHFETSKPENVFAKMTDLEEAIIDYRTLGYSLKGSLMKQLRIEIPHLPSATSRSFRKLKKNATIRCAGILLVDQRPPPAKGFGFITLEDEYGTIDLILPPDVYDKYKPVFRSSRFLYIEGRIQRLDDHVTVKAAYVESFAATSAVRSHQPTPRMLDRVDWIDESNG